MQTDVHGQSRASPTQHTACVTIHHHSRSPTKAPLVANAAITGAPRDRHSIHPPAADVNCSCWCPSTRIQVGGARSAGEHGGVTRGCAEPRCARARRPSPRCTRGWYDHRTCSLCITLCVLLLVIFSSACQRSQSQCTCPASSSVPHQHVQEYTEPCVSCDTLMS
jgi:hypothetical protein